MNKTKSIQIAVGVIIIAVAFFGGTKYGQLRAGKSVAAAGLAGRMNGQNGNRIMRGGANLIMGEVLAKDSTSITIKMRDGGSKNILLSQNGEVLKSVAGSSDDITIGAQISVSGTTNSDGSVTAKSIQIRPKIGVPQTTNSLPPANNPQTN